MDLVLAIATHLLLPGTLLILLVAMPATSTVGWIFQSGALSMPALIMSLGGAEWLELSSYLRFVVALAIAPCCLLSWRRRPAGAMWPQHGRQMVKLAACVACFGLEASLLAAIIQGYAAPSASALRIHRPLKHQRLIVISGGSSSALNPHFELDAQRYALDISAENGWGRKYRGLRPRKLQDYEVFGVPVVAPCSGEVTGIQFGQHDLFGAHVETKQPVGNGVAMHCNGATLVLAHLQEGSIRVKVGQSVQVGELLGRAGNSGNTTEPHLHIHAVRGRVTQRQQQLFDGEAVPLRFEPGNRWTVRGTRF